MRWNRLVSSSLSSPQTCFPSVFQHFSSWPWSIKGQLPQHSCAFHQGPWTKCISILHKCCLIWSSSPSVYLWCSLLPLSLGSWFLEGQSCSQRLRQRRPFIPESFPGPHLAEQWDHIFPSLSLVTYVLIQALLVYFDISGQMQFHLAFRFSNFIPGCSDNASAFLPCYHTLLGLYPCTIPFTCLSLMRSSLFIHTGHSLFLSNFIFIRIVGHH